MKTINRRAARLCFSLLACCLCHSIGPSKALAGANPGSAKSFLAAIPPATGVVEEEPSLSLHIADVLGVSGGLVVVPIAFRGSDKENGLSFSLSFTASQASFVSMTRGGPTTNVTFIVNTNLAPKGQIGVVFSMPPNRTLPTNESQLLTLTLRLATGLAADTVIPIQFANSPAPKSVADVLGNDLTLEFVDGSITVAKGYEGDVAPRTGGNNVVNAGDLTMIGRIVAGLESNLSAAEFQRADCAPGSSHGNGILNAGDVTQVTRLLAGLDPQAAASGPTSATVAPASLSPKGGKALQKNALGTRQLKVVNTAVTPGGTVTAVVRMAAEGNENALSCSLVFDASKLRLIGGAADANLILNTDQASNGRVGVVISLPVNESLSRGSVELLKLTFQAGNVSGNVPIEFVDAPAPQSVSDVLGNDLVCQFVDGVISVESSGRPPAIDVKPAVVTAANGGATTLSISVAGATAYQWQMNGENIPGANGSSFTLNNLTPESAGLYTVVISNASGSFTSSPTPLTFFGDTKMYAGITLAGPVGTQFTVEYQDAIGDPNTWENLSSITLPSSPYLFIDPQSPGKSQRYYRAVVVP